jgi:uncharacterized protein YydD (DUF2326 family)
MIHSITANMATFRSVTFTAGLNVIVAERTEASTEKDTRNGLGKSTLIDIIDFCLGGTARRGSKLQIEPLQDWIFTMDVTIASNRVQVTRAVSSANRIVIKGDTAGWPDQPDLDQSTGERMYNVNRWRNVLGWALFGLPVSNGEEAYKPTYRSAISYFIRTKPGAYLSPFKYLPQQKGIVSQVNIAYLLGLSWEYASKLQELEETVLGLTALEKGNVSGAGSIGDLEAQRVPLERRARELENAVNSFKVHPQYVDIQVEADRLTSEAHALANENVSDRRRLARYKEASASEAPPDTVALQRLYEQSGVVFNDSIRRTLLETSAFHQTVVSNRRSFLEAEIRRIEHAISDRENKIEDLTAQRSESLEVLRSHGALQEMTQLQSRHVRTMTDLQSIQARIDNLRSFKLQKRKAEDKQSETLKIAELEHEERRQQWELAIQLFNDNSQALYETPGKLVIDIGETGYSYEVEIERSGSEGVGKMKIFCFDLALLQLQLLMQSRMNFLIHDTLMYDAVDPRQRARALERAHRVSTEGDAQYICTMNSDMIPRSDFSQDFNFDQCVRLTLTDKTPAGSLLGIRFERTAK